MFHAFFAMVNNVGSHLLWRNHMIFIPKFHPQVIFIPKLVLQLATHNSL